MADQPNTLTELREWASGPLAIAGIPRARQVLALLDIAEAAKAYRHEQIYGGGLDERDAAADALDAALSRLENA